MNYYDETLLKIKDLIQDNKIDLALSMIEEELRAPYLPKEFQDTITKIYAEYHKNNKYEINDEICEEYLFLNKEKQLIAVTYLDKKNLREYLDLINRYLSSDGFINAKVLLIDSLIKQEINEEIKMINDGLEYEFIPKYLLPVEESDAFIVGKKQLEDKYLKEPSKLKMAMDLLYKELMLMLPINGDNEEGNLLSNKIIEYIEKAFN